jgi:hypothetical protein
MFLPLIFLSVVMFYSCNMMDSGKPLPGKIVVRDTQKYECFIYVDSDIPKSSFKLKKDKEVEYSGVDWLNTRDAFIGTESVSGFTPMEFRLQTEFMKQRKASLLGHVIHLGTTSILSSLPREKQIQSYIRSKALLPCSRWKYWILIKRK